MVFIQQYTVGNKNILSVFHGHYFIVSIIFIPIIQSLILPTYNILRTIIVFQNNSFSKDQNSVL